MRVCWQPVVAHGSPAAWAPPPATRPGRGPPGGFLWRIRIQGGSNGSPAVPSAASNGAGCSQQQRRRPRPSPTAAAAAPCRQRGGLQGQLDGHCIHCALPHCVRQHRPVAEQPQVRRLGWGFRVQHWAAIVREGRYMPVRVAEMSGPGLPPNPEQLWRAAGRMAPRLSRAWWRCRGRSCGGAPPSSSGTPSSKASRRCQTGSAGARGGMRAKMHQGAQNPELW